MVLQNNSVKHVKCIISITFEFENAPNAFQSSIYQMSLFNRFSWYLEQQAFEKSFIKGNVIVHLEKSANGAEWKIEASKSNKNSREIYTAAYNCPGSRDS